MMMTVMKAGPQQKEPGLTVQLAGLLWRLCSVGLSQQKPRMKRLRMPQAIRNKPSRMLLSSASEYS